MARAAEQIVRDTLGNMQVQLIQLTLELEQANERADEAEKALAEAKKDAPSA